MCLFSDGQVLNTRRYFSKLPIVGFYHEKCLFIVRLHAMMVFSFSEIFVDKFC